MIKKAANEEELQEMILFYNQSRNTSGLSPSELLIGRNVQTVLPTLTKSFKQVPQEALDEATKRKNNFLAKQKVHHDKHAKDLHPIPVGTKVRIYNFHTKKWDMMGTVLNVDEHRSYMMKTNNHTTLFRNRRFVREARTRQDFAQDANGQVLVISDGNNAKYRILTKNQDAGGRCLTPQNWRSYHRSHLHHRPRHRPRSQLRLRL